MLALSDYLQRLRSVRDDCAQRANLAPECSVQRVWYWQAYNDAERALRSGSVDDPRLVLARVSALAKAARLYDNDPDELAALRPTPAPISMQQPPAAPPIPSTARKTTDLAELHGMTERGARKRIKHAFDRGTPGFFRGRRGWLAEPDAFASSA